MGQEWWDKERKSCYQRASFCCDCCGVSKDQAVFHPWLEAHEVYDTNYETGRLVFKELVALCHACHNYIHSGRLQMLVDSGEIPKKKQTVILKHGNAILRNADIKKPKDTITTIAPWANWRLVFNGQEYKSLFKSYAEWEAHYFKDSEQDDS